MIILCLNVPIHGWYVCVKAITVVIYSMSTTACVELKTLEFQMPPVAHVAKAQEVSIYWLHVFLPPLK